MTKCSTVNVPEKKVIKQSELCKIIEEVMGVGETCACCVDVVSQILGKLGIEVTKD